MIYIQMEPLVMQSGNQLSRHADIRLEISCKDALNLGKIDESLNEIR